ncbi:MAG: squalene synthase HpnC [Bacteroidota bacterium]|nr:squalene synthase HpnC [Bacteroidota bacterium]
MADELLQLAAKHYENFPVGSVFIPRKYRTPIHLIYAFVRVADDIADEGSLNSQERIEKLNGWGSLLQQAIQGRPSDGFFEKLAAVIATHELPVQLFEDLLTAFRKDAENVLYQSFDDVLDYCTYSANPIGRLLLKIFHCSNEETERLSDDICTALQLTNFWQDISVDTRRNRFYIARDEFQQYRLSLIDLYSDMHKDRFVELMKYKIEWTKNLFESGKPLFHAVPKSFRYELKLTWHGGMRVLKKIEEQGYDTRLLRPKLETKDKLLIAAQSLLS